MSDDIQPEIDEIVRDSETAVSVDSQADEVSSACETGKSNSLKAFFKDIVLCMAQVLILTFIIINFVGRVSVVQGQSMYPSLDTNNRIIVNLFVYHFHNPARGEIVIFKCPENESKDYIKRVIGLPGEELEIKDSVVYIDGKELKEPYIKYPFPHDTMKKIKLTDDEIFVLGDNRGNSEDSRVWGPVHKKLIKGKAVMRFWPPESLNWFK